MDIIIGAGISGLSYAAFCGHTDYLIVEQSDKIGGYCKTTERNGYVWDYSGHFFHFKDKEIEQFIAQNIPAEDLLTIYKHTQIRYKDRLIDYPFQMNIHQLPQQEFIDCLYDLFENPTKEYTNFQEMLYAKFGKSIADKFLIPYNSKLYACDLNTLDKDAMGRFFPYAEKEQIIRNFKASNNDTYNATFVYPKHGAIQYIDSMASHVEKDAIRLSEPIVAIHPQEHIVTLQSGEKVKYDRLISTIPFSKLLELLGEPKNPMLSWNQVLVFNIGFDKQGLDTKNHWIYFPEDKYCFYRVGFYSNILGSDKCSLYVELGFDKYAQVVSEDLLPRVLKDLQEAQIISADMKVVDYETIIMNPAYVHVSAEATEFVHAKKEQFAKDDIYSIGRYGSWTYCSIEDNIKEAKALAAKLN